MNKTKIKMKWGFTLLAFMCASQVHATETAGQVSKFTASIAQSCTITGTGIAFGSYASTGTNATNPLDGSTTITVTCSAGTSSVIANLTAGLAPSATCNTSDNYRAMRIGTATDNLLTYKLYSDTDRTQEWGCDVSNQQILGPFPLSNVGIAKTIYGRIPPNQYLTPGSYSDTVQFTITF